MSAPARRSSRCSRRWLRWRTACRSRSWRPPRSWPNNTSRTFRSSSRRRAFAWRCSPARPRAPHGGSSSPTWSPAPCSWWSARMRSCRATCASRSWASRSSTSSTGLACFSGRRFATKAGIPTLYGDLDLSVIRELPAGRLPIKTVAKPESRRDEVYEFVRGQLDAGRLAYVIYPLVEESAKVDVKAATEMHDHLAQEIFPQYRVGLLHGRMKADAKERVMAAFARGELQLLVATTVVEVGVDVPNASVMIVEHAERFGLSQLHQLRGRVGRDRHQSYCFLLYQSPLSDEARERLKAMTETTDGFEIAERDLVQRGPGDFFGTRQAGLPTFRMIELVRDRDVLDLAQREAGQWFAKVKPAPDAVERLLANWNQRFRLIAIG